MPEFSTQCYWYHIEQAQNTPAPNQPTPHTLAPWGDDPMKRLMIEASRRLGGQCKISPLVPSEEVRDAAIKEIAKRAGITKANRGATSTAPPPPEDPNGNFAINPLHTLYLGKKRLRNFLSNSARSTSTRSMVGDNTISPLPSMSTSCAINAVMHHLELAPFTKEEFNMAVQSALHMSSRGAAAVRGGEDGLSDAAWGVPIVRAIHYLMDRRGLICETLTKEEQRANKGRVRSESLVEREKAIFLVSENASGVVAAFSEWMPVGWYMRHVPHIDKEPEDPTVAAQYDLSRGPKPWCHKRITGRRRAGGALRMLCSIPSPIPWTFRSDHIQLPQRKELMAFTVRLDPTRHTLPTPEIRYVKLNIPAEPVKTTHGGGGRGGGSDSDPFRALQGVASGSQAKQFLSETQGESQGARRVLQPWFDALLHNTTRAKLLEQNRQLEMNADGDFQDRSGSEWSAHDETDGSRGW